MRCSGFHIGRSPLANQAPTTESQPIHRTQQLPGSALRYLVKHAHLKSRRQQRGCWLGKICPPRASIFTAIIFVDCGKKAGSQKPVHLSQRKLAWPEAVIDEWIANKIEL